MARMVLADGEVKDEEKVTMADVLQKFVGRPVDRDYVDTLIAEAQRDSREPEEIASSFAGSLNPRGAEVVVKAALHIAMSDGDLAKAEVSLLSRISSALGMTSAHFRAVMEETLATPPDNGAGNSAAASVH